MNNATRLATFVASLFGIACAPVALSSELGSGEEAQAQKLLADNFRLGIGGGLFRFNSSYKLGVDDRLPIFIDGEGTLGLEDTTFVPIIYGQWHFAERHAIGFHYFRIDREGSEVAVDRQFDALRINGVLRAQDKSSFYYLNYSYAFQSNEHLLLKGLFGIYTVDLDFQFEGIGEISINDVPVESGRFSSKVEKLAPLPMLGLQFWAKASKNWALGARLTVVGGEVNDLQGFVIEADVTARYRLAKHVGLILGASYFNGDLEITDTDEQKDLTYGYDGVYVGLDFNF